MTNKTMALLAVLGMTAGLMLTGCSEETKQKAGDALDATKDAAASATNDAKQMGGEVIEKTKEVAGEVKDKLMGASEEAGAAADGAAEDAAAQMDDAKASASSAAGAASGDLMTQATDMIAKIKSYIEANNFSDAQALLDKLKGMPGVDQLTGIQDQLGSLQSLIDQGKKAGEAVGGLMGQ